jgi:2-oxoglutarate ferredoxin oxidoreductase subunit alpha
MTTKEILDGAEAIARGALSAGCDFFAGYPITPASDILAYMLRDLPRRGGLGIQGEDEIASMGFCIGAALGGATPMTATSGPGLALYAEQIGAAIMVELPLVIVVVQRMGPSTGAATAGAQGDIAMMRWGTSGGYPVIVLAPTDVVECYHLTHRAFQLARRFRVPVFLAAGKELVTTAETAPADAFDAPPAAWPSVLDGVATAPLVPYTVDADPLRYTASSHDDQGYITKDPKTLDALNRHLAEKIERRVDEITLVDADLEPSARTLLISYGITARSMVDAVEKARERDQRVSSLTIHSLWPVPEGRILDAASEVERVVVAELNLGQYRREVERLVGGSKEVVGIHRVDGELIKPQQILAEIV